MKKAAANLEFEDAAKCRDEIRRLEMLELDVLDGGIASKLRDIAGE